MLSVQQPFLRSLLLVNLFYLGGCSQSVFIKTPVNTYHDIEGGIVSQPRLPVPGNDEKYPYVGLTPTSAPPLPSPELRKSITDSLSHDRNLTEWKNADVPLTIPKVPPIPNQKNTTDVKTAPTPNVQTTANQISSANFDAAGEPPPVQQNTSPSAPSSAQKNSPPPPPPVKKNLPVKPEPVVMPELRGKIDNQNVVIPSIPLNPPAPSQFPGFNIPADVNLPPPVTPPTGLSFENPSGELIRFPIDSDTPYAKQEGTINDIAWRRNKEGSTLYVHGYGDTSSLDPETQTKALSLALLRAKTVAKLLIAHNVPESAIVIRAHSFGHGVRIRTDN